MLSGLNIRLNATVYFLSGRFTTSEICALNEERLKKRSPDVNHDAEVSVGLLSLSFAIVNYLE